MEQAVWLYVDAVLRARDALLDAGIRVIGYDLYPNGLGSLLIAERDRKPAAAALTSCGIQATSAPREPGAAADSSPRAAPPAAASIPKAAGRSRT